MAAAGHLSGGRLNLTLLREAAREELKSVLGDERQKKVSLQLDMSGAVDIVCVLNS